MHRSLILLASLSLLLTGCAAQTKPDVRLIDNRAQTWRQAADLAQTAPEGLQQACQTPEEAYRGALHLQHSKAQTEIALSAYKCERVRAEAWGAWAEELVARLLSLAEGAEQP